MLGKEPASDMTVGTGEVGDSIGEAGDTSG
jgi:hypothetical protein